MSLLRTLMFLARSVAFGLPLVICFVSIAAGSEEVTIPELVDAMRVFKQRFEAHSEWLIEYTHNREYHALPPEFRPNMPRTKVINARKGEWWYLFHEIERYESPQERPIRVWATWKDNVCVHRIGGVLSILPDMHPNLIERCFYTNTLFLNIHSKRKFNTKFLAQVFAALSPNEAFPNGLPDSVEADIKAYEIKSPEEFVDGDPCVVIQRGNRDTMWLDLVHGGVCRRRIEYSNSGEIAKEYRNQRLKQCAEGLWLPQYQEVTTYNGDDTSANLRGKIRYVERNEVTRVQFGNVPKALFDVPRPNRGYVNDHVRGVIYETHPPDTKPSTVLADAASRARALSGSPPTGRGSLLLVGANTCALAALLLWFQIRRARTRRNAREMQMR